MGLLRGHALKHSHGQNGTVCQAFRIMYKKKAKISRSVFVAAMHSQGNAYHSLITRHVGNEVCELQPGALGPSILFLLYVPFATETEPNKERF
jgi:hypothetical protein